MPNGIFASQFGYSNPYDPVGLETGMPTVGATLGKKKPGNPKEPVGEKVNPRATGGEAAAGEIAAGNAQGLSAANGAAAGLAAQGTRNKLATMEHAMAIADASQAPSSGFGGGNFGMPTTRTSGATVPVHSQPASGGGLFGGFGHWVAHTFDSARHGAAHVGDILGQTFQQQNSFGEPQFQSKDYPAENTQQNHNPITGISQHGQPTDMQQFINRPGGRYADIPGISANNRGFGADMPEGFLSSAPRQVAAAAPEAANNWWDNVNPAQFLETAAKDVEQEA